MDNDIKACVFALIVLGAYVVHQITVGGDGVILASVVGTICAIGGYALRPTVEKVIK